ncbi:endolytic transglycosylase MltG [uncultured Eubacterium sp.]|uniref:endolytic transglycosylase MltG n=1 Tax=uncultured Eubacterium sp. TaxID=165185 RepID=UPI0015B930A3|nr:endolytic transglycosylase MltG [uncultured Eubacterium sp.]
MANKKRSKLPVILLVILIVIALAVAGVYVYGIVNNDIAGENQEDKPYTLIIEKSDFEYEVGQKLAANGVIVSDTVWTNWMSSHYPDFEYINGEYNMNSNMSYEDIAKKLQNPDISHKSVKVCIPEGTNVMQIADILEKNNICKANDFLEVCKSTDGFDFDFLKTVPDTDIIGYKLEGFLFPATYDFAMNSDAVDIAEQMLEAFDYRITDDMTAFCENNNMSMFELITLASVVQEEALGQKSAKNIASVFMNRLNKGAKLQSDVTYFYARDLRDSHGFSQEVYDAYYTYRCQGLPAGPITNSGMEIIDAVVNYPQTDYLYFFSDLQQEFHFAKDYDEFVRLQKQYPWK